MKFVTGRIDCNNENEALECLPDNEKDEYSGYGFVTCKTEVNTKTNLLLFQ